MTTISRPRQIAATLLLAAMAACSTPAAEAGPVVTVYKTPTCGCCTAWEDHMRENGFQVKSESMNNLQPVKHEHEVPSSLISCHTAVIDGYVVEGHVPADVVRRLIAERPDVDGIAVPGMPMGSPGMEGPYVEPYEVYTFKDGQPVEVYEMR